MTMMNKDKEWYLAWQPGNAGYSRDDIILAVGLKSSRVALYLHDIIEWLGAPDKVSGNAIAGSVVYYFESQHDTAAHFDIIEKQIKNCGTISRNRDNSLTRANTPFNILDLMEEFSGSEMRASIEPDP